MYSYRMCERRKRRYINEQSRFSRLPRGRPFGLDGRECWVASWERRLRRCALASRTGTVAPYWGMRSSAFRQGAARFGVPFGRALSMDFARGGVGGLGVGLGGCGEATLPFGGAPVSWYPSSRRRPLLDLFSGMVPWGGGEEGGGGGGKGKGARRSGESWVPGIGTGSARSWRSSPPSVRRAVRQVASCGRPEPRPNGHRGAR